MRRINGQVISTALVIGATGLAVWWFSGAAGRAASATGTALNPTDRDNIFNRGFNGLFQSVTGSEGTLGTELANFFSDGQ